MDCNQCKEVILEESDSIVCSNENCKSEYHFSCAGFSLAMYRKLTPTHKAEWTCLKCKSKKKTEPKSKQEEDEADKFKAFMEEVSRKLELLAEIKEDVNKIKIDNSEIIKSQEHISNQYDDIVKKLESLPALEREIQQLKTVVQQKNEQINMLETRLNQLEQYGRNKNIEINEVEEQNKEDVEQIVVDVAKKMGVDLIKEDIEIAHRLPKTRRENRPATIIVQLVRRKKREEFLAARKKVVTNNQVTGLSGGRIYVSENLSPYYRNLLKEAKKKGRELGYKFIWYKNAAVRLRKHEASEIVIVSDMAQLGKIK